MSKKAIVVLSPGAEEMESVIVIDVLRRAGICVVVAGLTGIDPVICSRGVKIIPDTSFYEASQNGPYDVIILPGGLDGAKNMCASDELGAFLKEQEQSGRIIAAICAAPTVLKTNGIAVGKTLTSHPTFKDEMQKGNFYTYVEKRVFVDGNLITSRGPGTSFVFALTIIEKLLDKKVAEDIAKPMLGDFEYVITHGNKGHVFEMIKRHGVWAIHFRRRIKRPNVFNLKIEGVPTKDVINETWEKPLSFHIQIIVVA